jgi:hypothetical protein
MPLLKLSDIDRTGTVAGSRLTEGETAIVNAASLKLFRNYLDPLHSGRHYHFWNGGQWSMQDLLIYLLGVTGTADVWITTWSISENAVRSLLDMRQRRMIRELKCVLDYKSKEIKTKAYLLARENFKVSLARIHAKVTVIRNEHWCISITGSANWTRNPRAERQILCTEPEIATYDIGIIEDLITGNNPFKVR